jgi:hypothetical protein
MADMSHSHGSCHHVALRGDLLTLTVWMPYKEGMKRCNIGSKSTFQDARDELVGLGLIERTDDNSIYIIGRITGDNEWKSLLHLRCDAMMEGTDIEENGYRVSTQKVQSL